MKIKINYLFFNLYLFLATRKYFNNMKRKSTPQTFSVKIKYHETWIFRMNLNLETGFDKPDWICAELQCLSPKNICVNS